MTSNTFTYVDRWGKAWVAERCGANDEDVSLIRPLFDDDKENSDGKI